MRFDRVIVAIRAAIWPFDTPGELTIAGVFPLLLAEAVGRAGDAIKDRAQVQFLARALWALSRAGRQGALFAVPKKPCDGGRALGAGHAARLEAALAWWTISYGLPERLRADAARLYWEAFGGKLGTVLGPERRAQDFLLRVLRADHCYVALGDDGALLGIAGFKSPHGSFAGGNLDEMRAVYGRFGALWRGGALWTLSHEVDNDRFLVDGIAVARAARGRGIGSLLLDALCEEGRKRGYASIRLEVIDSNWRARSLYERQGFMAVRTERIGPLRYLFGFSAATTMVRPL